MLSVIMKWEEDVERNNRSLTHLITNDFDTDNLLGVEHGFYMPFVP